MSTPGQRVDQTPCIESPTGKHERANGWWCEHCSEELGPEHDPMLIPELPKPIRRTFCNECCTPMACCDTEFVHCSIELRA